MKIITRAGSEPGWPAWKPSFLPVDQLHFSAKLQKWSNKVVPRISDRAMKNMIVVITSSIILTWISKENRILEWFCIFWVEKNVTEKERTQSNFWSKWIMSIIFHALSTIFDYKIMIDNENYDFCIWQKREKWKPRWGWIPGHQLGSSDFYHWTKRQFLGSTERRSGFDR